MDIYKATCWIFVIGFMTAPMWTRSFGDLHLGSNTFLRSTRSTAPDITMSADSHWLNVSCIVRAPRPGLKVFIRCPSLKMTSSYCYENCIPSRPCPPGTKENDCVPDISAVNCTETLKSDGSKVTTLRMDKRDRRVEGQWFCFHAGQKSNIVNVGLDIDPPSLDTKPKFIPPEETVTKEVSTSSTTTTTFVPQTEEPPVYFAFASFMSKSPWIFCIIAIFIISITINVILWIRWCLLCIFAEQRKSHNDDQKVLGEMLCLPTQMKKTNSELWENDIFPGSQIGDGFQNPLAFDARSQNFHHFNTFSPAYLIDRPADGSQTGFRQFDDNEFAFPQIATMRPDQMGMLYRAKSAAGAFSPSFQNPRDWSTMQSNRICSATGAVQTIQPLHPSLESPIPAPSQYNANSRAQSSKNDFSNLGPLEYVDSISQQRLPRVTLNSISGVTLYDDVATGSSITVMSRQNGTNSRGLAHPSNLRAPYLPRMAEFIQQENEEELKVDRQTNESPAPNHLYVEHSLPPPPDDTLQQLVSSSDTKPVPIYHSLETFGRKKKNSDGENDTDDVFNN